MADNSIKVYGYTRVSTEGQVKNGYSLTEQQTEIENFCKKNGYDLIKVFSDRGISGAKANEEEMSIERDGLLEMLASMKKDSVRFIVVLNTNRLWRSDIVKILIHRELKKCSVDVKAIDRPSYSIYTQSPSDVITNGMFELIDTYERLEISLKLQRGRKEKAKGGGYSGGGAPYGYNCNRGSKKLVVNEEEAVAVKRLFHLRSLFEGATLKVLAEYMNTEGYRGRNRASFTPMLVKRILDREEFYRGVYHYGGVKSLGDYEAIL